MTAPTTVRQARDALLSAVHAGAAVGLLPPVVTTGGDGLVRIDRHLRGPADAGLIAKLLDRPDCSILLEVLAQLADGCKNLLREFPGIVGDDILRPLNGALFGPLTGATFLACLSGPETVRRYRPACQTQLFLDFLRRFLQRLTADAGRWWFDARLPVTGLACHDGETHNGRQHVLRVDLADGRSIAYKPRPADVDRVFLAPESSVFALLNQLPPASGPLQLPLIDGLPGDGTYAWQEWIEPPDRWGAIRQEPHTTLYGASLSVEEAQAFWHRAGSLTAACFGFGITDLSEGNLYVGVRPGRPEPLMYPIDLEIAFVGVHRLSETGLVAGKGAQHHHVGLETEPRLCAADGPTICLVERDGELAVWRRTRPWAREETRTVIADATGRTGYGPHVTRFLRGMFDAWTLLCSNVPKLQTVLDQSATTRTLLRSTSQYGDMLDDLLLFGTPLPHDVTPSERVQLLRQDVPYFYRSIKGGPLLHWDPANCTTVESNQDVPALFDWAQGLTLARLGTALRDAVAPLLDDEAVPASTGDRPAVLILDGHARLAVRDADHGAVAFDWPQVNRRITYRWSGTKLTLRLAALDELSAIGERLLKLDAVDAAWRSRWAEGAFQDDSIGERLTRLTGAAARWLQQVIDAHGWPGPLLVGEEAAEAACRLVQHLEDQPAFQRRCLDLLAAAVDVPGRHVAYLTDALCVTENRPQIYGTKFHAVEGRLVPCPLEDPDTVDGRRAALGLEPLAAYAERLRQRFPLATSEVS